MFFGLATLAIAAGDEPASSSISATTPVDASASQSPKNPGSLQAPVAAQNAANDQGPNTPLLPYQGGNPNSPYSNSSTYPQSSQLTAPTLYITGANDLSQISTNAALSQAFSQQQALESSYMEMGMDYEHAPIERIRIGPLDLKSALVLSVISDDNLRTGTGQNQSKIGDTYYNVTPAVLLQYGTHEGQRGYASLVYSPTIVRFLHQSSQDSDNQNVALNLQYPFQRLSLDLTETYTQTSGLNTDSDTRTTQTTNLASVGGSYEIDDKLYASSHVQETDSSYTGSSGQGPAGGLGDQTTSVNNSISYRLAEKITLSPSVNVGWDRPQAAIKNRFEQVIMGLTYAPTQKLSLFGQGGAQFTHYDQAGDVTDPIFSAGIGYTPFDSTILTLSGSQSVHASTAEIGQAGALQSVVDTGVGVSLTQRIVQRFFLNLGFNYDHTDTQADGSNQGGGITFSQDIFTYRSSLSYAPSLWSTVAIYYQYSSNESNSPGSTYHDNQMGITISAQF
jgi:hypothetical protein